jgi:uncharacterized protein
MPSFEIRNTKSKGKGLYSLMHFAENQVILPFKGKVLDKKTVYELPDAKSEVFLQIGSNAYLNLAGEISLFINHSCNPNTMVKIMSRTAFLIATRPILPNEELCFDYSLTCTEPPEDWVMTCTCNEWNCRKTISGFKHLSDKDKEKYLKLNIVPKYIIK